MYFESHAHYDDRRFNKDRDALLEEFPRLGIDYVVNVGADMQSSKLGIRLSERYDYFYAAVGVHPHDAKSMSDKDIETLRTYAKHDKVVAIGEIGLDFHYDNSPRDVQRHWFVKQLELAKELDMPVIIHSRDSAQPCFDIIKNSGVSKGVIHCFSDSPELGLEYVKLGYYLGIGGVITYNNARKLVETVEKVPLEKILIETDAPYLTPNPNRGKRNDSANLAYIVERIAQIKKVTPADVAKVTKNNAFSLFLK